MLERLLRMYAASMSVPGGVRSIVPHLFGPPGSGKSTVIADLAQAVGARVHTINVSRLSPLEIEGVQMPMDNNSKLKLLTATYWTNLKDGDILLLDEFLRGFPEVYNGLLDILTSREVGGFKIANVFIIAASNSTATYDRALEDRLFHIPVEDPRNNRAVRNSMMRRFVEETGLSPEMTKSSELSLIFDTVIQPTFNMLDTLRGSDHTSVRQQQDDDSKTMSMRKVIGLIQLRELEGEDSSLEELIFENNRIARNNNQLQFLISKPGVPLRLGEEATLKSLLGHKRLTPVQTRNIEFNLSLESLLSAKLADAPPATTT